jgi:hypothetical protein
MIITFFQKKEECPKRHSSFKNNQKDTPENSVKKYSLPSLLQMHTLYLSGLPSHQNP